MKDESSSSQSSLSLLNAVKLTNTKNVRKKVILKPGRSLVEWIRLSNAGRLAISPQQKSVDHIELSRHNRENDCWILLFDTVFDVTKYFEFHPGGVEELMCVAGTDGSRLFEENHRWVNYKGILKSCVIGPFIGDRSKLSPPRKIEETNE